MKEFIEKLIDKIENEAFAVQLEKGIKHPSTLDAMLEKFSVFRIKEIVNQLADEYNNDFCEWKGFDNSLDENSVDWVYETTCGKYIGENHISSAFQFCPYCSKKIKIATLSAERRVVMADRHRLHISKLEDFKEWLIKDGWDLEEPKGTWEALRARKSGRKNPLIVYTKMDAKEHLSVMDRDSGVIGAFLRDSKKPKTNADRIRSMSDEELAEHFSELIKDTRKNEYLTGVGDWLLWLQSEAE